MRVIKQILLVSIFVIALGPIILFTGMMNLDRILRGEVGGSDVRDLFREFTRVRK